MFLMFYFSLAWEVRQSSFSQSTEVQTPCNKLSLSFSFRFYYSRGFTPFCRSEGVSMSVISSRTLLSSSSAISASTAVNKGEEKRWLERVWEELGKSFLDSENRSSVLGRITVVQSLSGQGHHLSWSILRTVWSLRSVSVLFPFSYGIIRYNLTSSENPFLNVLISSLINMLLFNFLRGEKCHILPT